MVAFRLRTEDILAEVNRERVRLIKDAPEPTVINVDAVLVLGQERTVAWGAITLHAPPLSFVLGARLFVASNAIRDLQDKKAPEASVKAAQSVAAALLRKALKPVKKLDRLRCWSCVFTKDSPDEVRALIDWLLDVPDQAGYEPSSKRVTVDFMDNVAQFARSFPAWMKDGWPLSWAHYQYGMRHLGRAWVREELRLASAARAGQAEKKDFQKYVSEQKHAAGWS